MEGYKGRRSITIYIDRKVWSAFEKFIKPSGSSPSRMLETIMRVAVDPKVARIWESIYYTIPKAVGEVEKSGALREKRKSRADQYINSLPLSPGTFKGSAWSKKKSQN